MDPRNGPVEDDGPSQQAAAPPASPRRRLSMDEDLFYQQIMTAPPRRPSHPPPYDSVSPTLLDNRRDEPSQSNSKSMGPDVAEAPGPAAAVAAAAAAGASKSKSWTWGKSKGKDRVEIETYLAGAGTERGRDGSVGGAPAGAKSKKLNDNTLTKVSSEELPPYSTSIALEGVFMKKHEIENTVKRAEDRQWHTVFVTLNGTALNVYNVKKDWGWGRTRDGPTISPDNPPWVRRSKLEKSYSLLHADAGIAADYKKRRYVIRIRAETDQFLLSCVELSTFVKWLECLFAAIDIAAPIDDRDFPRDMSIPRIQRVRWFRGQSPPRIPYPAPNPRPVDGDQSPEAGSGTRGRSSSPSRPQSPMSPLEAALAAQPAPVRVFERRAEPEPEVEPELQYETDGEDEDEDEDEDDEDDETGVPPPRIGQAHRLSTTSYPNVAIDPHSGKWFPEHQWSSAHDMLYAKLCYSNLLFRSPRKTNYIISRGKQWFVDWGTGRMVRVMPPTYGEVDYFGPWQIVHTENRRI